MAEKQETREFKFISLFSSLITNICSRVDQLWKKNKGASVKKMLSKVVMSKYVLGSGCLIYSTFFGVSLKLDCRLFI